MRESAEKLRVLDGTALKIIALITMIIDHTGAVFFPHVMWFRAVGRIAMPIFAFCVAEGFIHTRNRMKYLVRLGVFAVISEYPFDLAIFGGLEWTHQNVMLTFFLAVLTLILFEAIRGEKDDKGTYNLLRSVLAIAAFVLMCVVAILTKCDYDAFGIFAVFVFYLLKDYGHWPRTLAGGVLLAFIRNVGIQAFMSLSIIPLAMYNGKKGKGLKWLFYAAYPGHLLLFGILRLFVL